MTKEQEAIERVEYWVRNPPDPLWPEAGIWAGAAMPDPADLRILLDLARKGMKGGMATD